MINRILSFVLNFVSPWEKLLHKKPPLQALKAFGCACYPLLRSYPSHILQPKSYQCIFLGYPPMSKGYIFLDVTFGRIYISSQAIFHKYVFPSYSSVPSNSTPSMSSSVTPFSKLWLASLLYLLVESSLLVDFTSLSSVSTSPAPDIPSLPSLTLTEIPFLDSTSIPSSSLPSSDVLLSLCPIHLLSMWILWWLDPKMVHLSPKLLLLLLIILPLNLLHILCGFQARTLGWSHEF